MTYKKKLIEVALPLEAINYESAREKGNPFLKGHPRGLHQWWARRPLVACRVILFASLVDDPSSHPDKFETEEAQEKERQRLFRIIEALAKWENSNNDQLLSDAHKEILKSTGDNPPPVLDPFCGGGSIPFEAQRLGIRALASDLNPVAVLITKALIEIPSKFVGNLPINSASRGMIATWPGAKGLAADVRYYGKWIRDEGEKRIGSLYPGVSVIQERNGIYRHATSEEIQSKTSNIQNLSVLSWLWARTVKCPNPACGAMMPLVRSFHLSIKKGKEAWFEPVITTTSSGATPTVSFVVKTGKGDVPESPKVGRGATFKCLVCGDIANDKHIKAEGVAGRMGAQMTAIVAEGNRSRIYLPPTKEQEEIANSAKPKWVPEGQISDDKRAMYTPLYGLTHFHHLFTQRQLTSLTVFTDLIKEARNKILSDASSNGVMNDGVRLNNGGTGLEAYADAVITYLAFANDKLADYGNTICTWNPTNENVGHLFTQQTVPFVFDFVEANTLSGGLSFNKIVNGLIESVERLKPNKVGLVSQANACQIELQSKVIYSTDPPYYDNIGYADLTDFFYVWLRHSLADIYPDLLSTLLVPKSQELVASPHRFGGNKEIARSFFEKGFSEAFSKIRQTHHADYPLTVYYAFKQSEGEDNPDNDIDKSISSTGWETMLEGLISSGFTVTGTWPIRTERSTRSRGIGSNALATSIVLVCRPRPETAPIATRREFLSALKRELPSALKNLQHGNIAPVDLAQAAIGPGMAVFSRYGKVVEADGSAMRVRIALQIINQTLDEVLTEQEGEYDSDTRWAVAWFEQFGINESLYGDAETLSKAKNTSVNGMVEAGIISSRSGKVRLLKREELMENWNPATDERLTVWEVTQHLIRVLDQHGEQGAALLLAQVSNKNGSFGDLARDLAYRLFTTCERKGWTQEALAYNSLVVAWPEITRLASSQTPAEAQQMSLQI